MKQDKHTSPTPFQFAFTYGAVGHSPKGGVGNGNNLNNYPLKIQQT
jgi:hypothetical protein